MLVERISASISCTNNVVLLLKFTNHKFNKNAPSMPHHVAAHIGSTGYATGNREQTAEATRKKEESSAFITSQRTTTIAH